MISIGYDNDRRLSRLAYKLLETGLTEGEMTEYETLMAEWERAYEAPLPYQNWMGNYED